MMGAMGDDGVYSTLETTTVYGKGIAYNECNRIIW